MKRVQAKFLQDSFLLLALKAMLQRSKTYRDGVNNKIRRELKDFVKQRILEITCTYKNNITDGEHITNIQQLSNSVSKKYGAHLVNGRFRIGSTQKVLNVFLKYLWCWGEIKMPPHCPFDRRIISELEGCAHINWTQMDSIDEYKELVSAARIKAGEAPLARWELETYANMTL